MAHPDLALRPVRNELVSHCVVAGSKNPLDLSMGSVNYIKDTQNTQHAKIQFMGGHRIVNVSMDSGTAMIRDIINNLGT